MTRSDVLIMKQIKVHIYEVNIAERFTYVSFWAACSTSLINRHANMKREREIFTISLRRTVICELRCILISELTA